jgi:DhnA family fructose-bisphosphate aldolase class Ia
MKISAWQKSYPADLLDQLTELRIHHPEVIEQEARTRRRRAKLTRDGKLVLVAIDHPARGVTEIRADKLAMGDRWQFLVRARRVLDDPQLDGVLASTDVMDDLLMLSHLERRKSDKSFLDDRVLVGSMNRGGIVGAAFEMDDTFTCFTAARLAELGCDGGKMLCRLDMQDPAAGRTLTACAQAVTELRRHNLPAFLEPLAVRRKDDGGYETLKDAASMVRLLGIASALGESSAHVWLKVSLSPELQRASAATSLPILLLGGPARETPQETLRDFADGIKASPRVRGAIIGRNLLYPGDADPLPMCRALTALVHEETAIENALRLLDASAPAVAG